MGGLKQPAAIVFSFRYQNAEGIGHTTAPRCVGGAEVIKAAQVIVELPRRQPELQEVLADDLARAIRLEQPVQQIFWHPEVAGVVENHAIETNVTLLVACRTLNSAILALEFGKDAADGVAYQCVIRRDAQCSEIKQGIVRAGPFRLIKCSSPGSVRISIIQKSGTLPLGRDACLKIKAFLAQKILLRLIPDCRVALKNPVNNACITYLIIMAYWSLHSLT